MSIPKDWKTGKIKDLVKSLDAGVSVNSEDRLVKNGETGVLKVSAVSYGKFLPGEHKVALIEECDRLTIYPRKNRILISRANTPSLVGASVYIDRDYPNLFLPDKLWQTEPRHDNFSIRWLSYLIASDDYRTMISSHATGTSMSMKNISKVDLLNIEIVIPPLREQCKIAEILGVWDESIDLLEKLIVAKYKLKQGLMQQLLTGKKRFEEFEGSDNRRKTLYGSLPLDWKYIPIADIAQEYSVKNREANDLTVLSCSKYKGLVNSLEYFGKQVFSKDTSTYKIVEYGMFAYATNHIDEGSIGYQNLCDKALISPMYKVFKTNGDRVHDLFLYSVLKTEYYRQIFSINTSASVERRGSLRWKDFSKIKIPLPSLPEQEKIAAVLSAADDEISTLEKQLAAYKEQKRGLMQQLLTGRTRILGLEDGQDKEQK
jgi:restriction endonuclease S subunit